MVVEYLLGDVKQVEQLRIPDGVIHVLGVFPCGNDVPCTQDSQLLRKVALFHVQARAQVIHADFALPEFVQYSDPQRMGEGLEKLGLELADFTHDEYSYIFILCSNRQVAPSAHSRGNACRRNSGPLIYPQSEPSRSTQHTDKGCTSLQVLQKRGI